jgi:hypothetical protein
VNCLRSFNYNGFPEPINLNERSANSFTLFYGQDVSHRGRDKKTIKNTRTLYRVAGKKGVL